MSYENLKEHGWALVNIELLDKAGILLEACRGGALDKEVSQICNKLEKMKQSQLKLMDKQGRSIVNDYPY